MNKFFYVLPLLIILSCGHRKVYNNINSPTDDGDFILPNYEDRFNYTDKNGTFIVKASSGLDKKNKTYFTKRSIAIPGKDKDGVLEQSVVISDIGILQKKMSILRPKLSQYTVWFDGKKYFSEMKIDPKNKAIDLRMVSPETEWNGVKEIKFPNSTTLPCFFSQIIECAKISGFIKQASDKKAGSMSLMVIWEGFPYLNETFSDFPSELFSSAQLEYDGKTKESERRFNLKVAGQSIYYVLNDQDIMTKMFWVTQGISMVSKSVQDENLSDEDGGSF